MTGRPFGSRYGAAKRRADVLRGSQLAPRVRAAEASATPKPLPMTPNRRGLLEAIADQQVKYHPSSGWRCDGKTVNGDVREAVRAGWAHEWIAEGRPHVGLTTDGEKAIGKDEPA